MNTVTNALGLFAIWIMQFCRPSLHEFLAGHGYKRVSRWMYVKKGL